MATKLNGHRLKSKIKKIKHLYKRDKRKILSVANDAKEKFTDVEESMEKYAKANPWKTMGFSLLAGVVVAKLLHLRK